MGIGYANLTLGTTKSSMFQTIKVTDGTPPAGAIMINGGNAVTNTCSVGLTLKASDDTKQMALSDYLWGGCMLFPSWEPYRSLRPYNLPGGAGTKTVYVQYKDGAGNVSPIYSASITLDTTRPAGRLAINGGAPVTSSTSVNLDLFSPDSDVTEMQVWDDGWYSDPYPVDWVPYSPSRQWTFSTPVTGTRKVYAQFKDAAGNVSDPFNAAITLQPGIPSIFHAYMSVNGAPLDFTVYSNHYLEQATLQISVPFRYAMSQMQLGNAKQDRFGNWSVTWGNWETYKTSKPWNFAGQYNGVFANFQDEYGNLYGPIQFGYLLDLTPPTVGTSGFPRNLFAPSGGTLTATMLQTKASLHWSEFSDSQSGIGAYELYYSPVGFPDRSGGTLIYKGLATQFIQNGLTANRDCYYRLYAIDNVGNVSDGGTLQTKTLSVRRPLPFLNLLLD